MEVLILNHIVTEKELVVIFVNSNLFVCSIIILKEMTIIILKSYNRREKMEVTRPTVMEVSLENLKYNISEIQQFVGDGVKLMPVIKANGYGTYINKRIDILNHFEIVAVALVDEAIEIRKLGYQGEIFVLNQPYKAEIDKIINGNITIGISSNDFLMELGKRTEKVNVHVEIGTGMGRTGINPYRVEEYINEIRKYSNINIEGIYTHLSSADCDDAYTQKQLDSFKMAVDKAKQIGCDLKYIHCSASNGILNYQNSYYNLVRPGIILYGYESFDGALNKINLKPICKLKTKITFLKEVEAGTSIGYSRSYITRRKTKVATIPIGYADGFSRLFSNKGEVIINGKKAPIIGSICMDSFMADVSEIENVKLGDDVYIWDNHLITVEELAKKIGTINYEIICTISERVPRIFIE